MRLLHSWDADVDHGTATRNPNPDRETTRLSLNDNICRRTGYEDIVSSVELMAVERGVG
jgi:aerobic-type carbon monoxide dehydrogenase small subunit (CoxS/CutS family)